jgi:hypothetical protein
MIKRNRIRYGNLVGILIRRFRYAIPENNEDQINLRLHDSLNNGVRFEIQRWLAYD